MIEESKKYNLETIEGFETFANAKAFTLTTKETEDDGHLHFATHWDRLGVKSETGSSWDKI